MIRRSIEQLSLPSSSVAGRRSARLYQHVDDPAWLLYLAEWTSREEFDAYHQVSPMPGTPDQFQRLPDCRIYRRLALFERVLTPVSIIRADILDGSPETHAAQRDLALSYYRSEVRDRSGLVLLHVHETTEARPGLLIVSGWERADPPQLVDRHPEPDPLDRLTASGGTRQRFVGRPLAEAMVT